MDQLIIIIIAVSLSMDAFSLSLAYGTLGLSKKIIIKLSSIVGIFHFFMPLIGNYIGSYLLKILPINPNIIVFIIFSFIGVQMILETFKNEEYKNITSFSQLLFFSFAVSIDSFSLGVGLKTINDNYIYCSTIFSIFSFLFTYIGLILGKKINKIVGTSSTIIGGIILIILGIVYLF